MNLEAIGIPAAAAFTLFVLFLGALLNHRLSIAREKKKSVPLNTEERKVLVAASETGRILIMKADAHGEWVRAGKTDFMKPEDPALAAIHLEAFWRLVARGLAVAEGGGFKLSGSGFSVARALSKK